MTDPQYVLLAQELISRIKNGELRIGDRVPTELELCESRSLARGTVRQALRHLEDAGMITRRRGTGTTVTAPSPADGYHAFVGSRADMLAFVQRTRIQNPVAETVVAEGELVVNLGVPVGSEWYRVSGPREVRDSALPLVCWSDLYLGADLPYRRMLLTGEFDIVNLVRQRIEQEMTAARVEEPIAAALGIETGSAALVFMHRYFSPDDVLRAVGVHTHPADRYRIVTSVGSSIASI